MREKAEAKKKAAESGEAPAKKAPPPKPLA